jgi:signal peptidase II
MTSVTKIARRMHRFKRISLVALVFALCIGIDQLTKHMAQASLGDGRVITYLGNFFRLQYAENSGAFLSLGAALPDHWRNFIFVTAVAIVLFAVLGYLLLAREVQPSQCLALALVSSGGFSNLWDRVRYEGHVIDFMNVGIGSIRTGIFNVADMAIMAGVFFLILQPLLQGKK